MLGNKKNPSKGVGRKERISLGEKVTEAFELPKEVVLDIPRITIVGKRNMTIENYRGVFEYSETRIRVNTGSGIIKIEGNNLEMKEITSEEITIEGGMQKVEFI